MDVLYIYKYGYRNARGKKDMIQNWDITKERQYRLLAQPNR